VAEVAFVLAPTQNLFFGELVTALRDELAAAHGLVTSLHRGAFPPPREDLVYAVVPPHEYFTLMHGRIGPPQEVFDRCVFICAEQPGTHFFDWNVAFARDAGAVFDINRLSVRALREHGIQAEHLQLGWTQRWDRLTDAERDIDVLFMGAASDRRLELLSSYVPQLAERKCHFVISDNSRPNWATSPSFLIEDEKWALLRRSKVLLNIHQGDTPYFEWLRLVQAMATGAVVVSEESLDFEPLEPGRHFLSGRPEALGHLVEHLLTDGPRRWEIQTDAYKAIRTLPMSESVRGLADAIRRLAQRPVPDACSPFFLQGPPSENDNRRALARVTGGQAHEDAPERRILKDLKLDMIDLRRRLERLDYAARGQHVPTIRLHRRSRGWWGPTPRVSVLVTLYNYERHIEGALNSLLRSRMRDWEVIIVDDGSSDSSLERAAGWIDRHDSVPALLLRHPINRGLGHARTAAVAFARAEHAFVLDADNEILPGGFDELLAALTAHPDAAFAYGMLERFTETRSAGLVNVFPYEPGRFRFGNYIDAMAMIRTAALREFGGYRTDRRLHGWEDYDLWVRMAQAGRGGVHVPRVVARYRTTDHSMLTVTNISGAEARSVIAEAAPAIMTPAES
jgi:hypothetical protein